MTTFKFRAIEGIQARSKYYTVAMTIKQALLLFDFANPDVPPEERAQRLVDNNRAKKIAQYLLTRRNNYILPAIVAEVQSDTVFNVVDGSLGYLEVPIEATYKLTDGQHRLSGLTKAIEDDPSIASETISVVIFPYVNLKRSQTRFADINRNAVKTSASLNMLYDDNDVLSDITRNLIKRNDLLTRFTDKEKNSTSGKSPKMFALKDIYASINISFKVSQKLQKSNPQKFGYAVYKSFLYKFWNNVIPNMEEWQRVYNNKGSANEARLFTIATHALTVSALGNLAGTLLEEWDGNNLDGFLDRYDFSKLSSVPLVKTDDDVINNYMSQGKKGYTVVKNKTNIASLSDEFYQAITNNTNVK